MAPNARRFSQIRDDASETSFGVFANHSRSTTGSTQDHKREPKRRRISGLNARFDNMVRAMNTTYPGPSNPRQGRPRTRSSSDLSYPSSAIADAYNDLHESRIGENFALIKMQPLDGHRFSGAARQLEIETSKSKVQNHAHSIREALPEWLCSTFSTLTAKHPLRLLLPKKSPGLRSDATDDTSLRDLETDPNFAFNSSQITQTLSNDRAINLDGSTRDENHVICSTISQSTTPFNVDCSDFKANTQEYQSPSATCGDHKHPALDVVPFSTPGPHAIPVRQRHTTARFSQVNQPNPLFPSEFESFAFIPFSTPGPASGLKPSAITSCLFTKSPLYGPDCLADADTEGSVSSSRHLTSSLLPTAVNQPVSRSRHASNESSTIDFPLPPYHATPSDPAPAYSSDDVYNDSYYADSPIDDPDLEPQTIHQHTDDNLVNVFATPGPGYCGPRPIYFDSPIEEPSDQDRSKPGYEIDLDAIDFEWIPFNRKLTEDKMPAHERHLGSCQNPVPHYEDIFESRANCAGISNAESPKLAGLLPDSLPSPSPFRFTPHQPVANITLENTVSNDVDSQTLQTTKPAQPFAPAPGIFVSPLREKPETSILAPKTPQAQIIHPELRKTVIDEFPSSQSSHDSIQSWRDVDECCLPQN